MSAILPVLLAVPAAGAMTLATAPVKDHIARAITVATAGIALVVAAIAAATFDFGNGSSTQHVVDAQWLPAIDVHFHLGVDGISLPLVLLTALLVFVCAFGVTDRKMAAVVLLLDVGMLGTFVALDLVLFFVFFEIVLLPMYALIAIWGGPQRRQAALKFILFTLLGSGLMLVGFLVLYAATGTFDMTALAHNHGSGVAEATQVLAAVLMLVGFGVKAPMWPLHTWLPDAHTEAPTIGSVLLAGVLLKMGTYGFIRILLPDVPAGARAVAPALGCLAVVGIIWAALACLGLARGESADLKRLIAFSSVGHMGFVLLGIATLTAAGVQGALIGNIAHGVVTGLLFFLVGGIKDRFHTSDMRELGGGLLAKVPVLGGVLLVAAIASLGLPGLAGFWGEMLAMIGSYSPAGALSRPLFVTLLGFAALGTVLTAVYFLAMLRRVDFGLVPDRWRDVRMPDVGVLDAVAWAPLVAVIVAVGVWPNLVLGVSESAVRGLLP